VHTAADVLAGRAVLGGPRSLVVDEAGYTIGPKTADYLAAQGLRVEIITQQYALGETIGTTLRAALLERLLRAGVTITPMTALVRVDTVGARVRHVLTDVERDIPIDDVVVAAGAIGNDALYQAFAPIARARLPGAGVTLIGDAFAPRHLRHAIEDGAVAGRTD
jgi:pyruvate/2-oxoglutarate dehydrogenase complex dihydrolipoamide dehydrogenase (E3) component